MICEGEPGEDPQKITLLENEPDIDDLQTTPLSLTDYVND